MAATQLACAVRCEGERWRSAELPELDFEERCAGQVGSSLVWKTLEGEHERRGPAGTDFVFQLTQCWFHPVRGLIAERVRGHGELLRTPGQRSSLRDRCQPTSTVQEVSRRDLSHDWTAIGVQDVASWFAWGD